MTNPDSRQLIDCGHPTGCKCELVGLEKVPCGSDTIALCRAALRVRNGRWYAGAPTHVFAELLNALREDGIVLAREERHG
jgi:hypothetical protein